MLRMSFHDGTLNKEELIKFVNSTEKEVRYTYGLGFRNPTTNRELVTKDRALEIIESQSLLDATEEKDYLHLNAFSVNDMF